MYRPFDIGVKKGEINRRGDKRKGDTIIQRGRHVKKKSKERRSKKQKSKNRAYQNRSNKEYQHEKNLLKGVKFWIHKLAHQLKGRCKFLRYIVLHKILNNFEVLCIYQIVIVLYLREIDSSCIVKWFWHSCQRGRFFILEWFWKLSVNTLKLFSKFMLS